MSILTSGTYTVVRDAAGSITIQLEDGPGLNRREWTMTLAQLHTVRRFLILNRDLASLFHHLTGGTP